MLRNATLRYTLVLASIVCCTASVQAQDYPVRPVRMIMPYAPGGVPTLVGNLLVEHMGPLLGQTLFLDHRTGGAGVPAVTAVTGSPADGYTVGLFDSSQWGVAPAMQPDLAYDVLRDLTPVALIYSSPLTIAIFETVPARDMQEFIALVKSRPGEFKYGTPFGTIHHMAVETLKAELGLNLPMIPYKGAAETIPAMLRGDVQMMIININAIRAHVESGKMKVLAVTSGTRVKALPEVPTIAEAAGLPNFHFAGDSGLFVRAGTPRPVIDKLGAALAKAIAMPDVITRVRQSGVELTPAGPEKLVEMIREDRKRYVLAAQRAGQSPDKR